MSSAWKSYLSLCITLSMLSILLTGCWDRREVEERSSAVAISIDYADKKDDKRLILVSIQIPIPIKIAGGGGGNGGGGGGGKEAVRVMSATGFTVANAMTNLQKRLNQTLFFGHTRVIAISEDVARDSLNDILDGFRRDPELRRLLWILITEGKAVDLLRADPRLEQIPTVYIMTLMENGAKTGRIPDITLGRYYIAVSNASLQPIVNYVSATGEDVGWKGVALFNKKKMIGKLDSKQSWTLMHLRNEGAGGDFLTYPESDKKDSFVVIRPKQVDTKTDVKIVNGKVKANYHVYMQANILESNIKLDLSKPDNLEKLARIAEKDLEHQAKDVVKLLQNKYKIDAINLGIKVKAFHFKEWQRMKWEEDFPDSSISVSYRVEFRRTGMEMK